MYKLELRLRYAMSAIFLIVSILMFHILLFIPGVLAIFGCIASWCMYVHTYTQRNEHLKQLAEETELDTFSE